MTAIENEKKAFSDLIDMKQKLCVDLKNYEIE